MRPSTKRPAAVDVSRKPSLKSPRASSRRQRIRVSLVLRSRTPEVQKLQRKVRELEAKVDVQVRMRNLERRYEALRVENDLLKKAIRFNLERRRRNSSS